MISRFEQVLLKIAQIVQTAVYPLPIPPRVVRNPMVPEDPGHGGVVAIMDGERLEETPILSPLSWFIEHRAEIQVTIRGRDEDEMAARLEALVRTISLALDAEPQLGGLSDWARCTGPAYDNNEVDGVYMRTATIGFIVQFSTEGSVAS